MTDEELRAFISDWNSQPGLSSYSEAFGIIDNLTAGIERLLARLPEPREAAALASMVQELLEVDEAYWLYDPAVEYLNRLLAEDAD